MAAVIIEITVVPPMRHTKTGKDPNKLSEWRQAEARKIFPGGHDSERIIVTFSRH